MLTKTCYNLRLKHIKNKLIHIPYYPMMSNRIQSYISTPHYCLLLWKSVCPDFFLYGKDTSPTKHQLSHAAVSKALCFFYHLEKIWIQITPNKKKTNINVTFHLNIPGRLPLNLLILNLKIKPFLGCRLRVAAATLESTPPLTAPTTYLSWNTEKQ